MRENGFITEEEADKAKNQPIKVRSGTDNGRVHAEYIAETVRQLVYAQYGDEAYTRGLNVFTTTAGDVAWVCGKSTNSPAGSTAVGTAATSVADKYLPKACQS